MKSNRLLQAGAQGGSPVRQPEPATAGQTPHRAKDSRTATRYRRTVLNLSPVCAGRSLPDRPYASAFAIEAASPVESHASQSAWQPRFSSASAGREHNCLQISYLKIAVVARIGRCGPQEAPCCDLRSIKADCAWQKRTAGRAIRKPHGTHTSLDHNFSLLARLCSSLHCWRKAKPCVHRTQGDPVGLLLILRFTGAWRLILTFVSTPLLFRSAPFACLACHDR